ncbi:hypothetical protein MJO28_004470 [Puccinia striiformis f. sp. tritici]|uniref:Uncharacterized protein n=2 Tax=Puccinia striiformis TaxID=27350 RepID=A0A2S4W9T7_9BASI|nr:hypothetical protein MJO28_004470 [Puccinia striiformis f. sp. tritici]KAI7963405.1 hypothetical protein MJO29_003832 [Puccinia striiformis f. sp. tritici]KAI7967521.1 hypothetical protein MJO29_000798 [Puccinia striiformis f. sp. tritici]POW18535.1 hypothetical protein PSHT_05657 [Puccinia striiformis]
MPRLKFREPLPEKRPAASGKKTRPDLLSNTYKASCVQPGGLNCTPSHHMYLENEIDHQMEPADGPSARQRRLTSLEPNFNSVNHVNIVDDWKVPAAQQGIFRTSYVQTPIVSPAPSNTALPNRLAKFVTTFDGVREKRLTNSSELQEREAPIGPPERVESDIMRNFPRVESAHRSAGTSGFKRKNHPSDPPDATPPQLNTPKNQYQETKQLS